jgi:hypothetical protein
MIRTDDEKIINRLDFRGGMIDGASPFILEEMNSKIIYNASLDYIGELRKRRGWVRLIQDSLGPQPVRGLFIWKRKSNNTTYVFLVWNGNVYYTSDRMDWIQIADAHLTDVDTFIMDGFTDELYFMTGEEMLRWDGDDIRNVGIVGPTVAPTKDSDIVGDLTEGRRYEVVYQYFNTKNNKRSNISPSSEEVEATADGGIRFIVTCSDDPQVDKIRFYRSYGNSPGSYYYEGEVDNIGLTAYIDVTVADAVLSTDEPDKENTPPPKARFAVEHLARVFLAGTDEHPYRVYFSRPFPFHESFPQQNVLDVTKKTITALITLNQEIYVFMPSEIKVISTPLGGRPADTWQALPIESSNGCIARKSMATFGGYAYYLSYDGVYAFSGGVPIRISDAIRGHIEDINWEYADQAVGIIVGGKYFLSVPIGESEINDTTMIYNIALQSWTIHDGGFTHLVLDDDGMLAGSPEYGLVYDMFQGYDDDGADVDFYVRHGPVALQPYHVYKQGVVLYLLMEGEGNVEINIIDPEKNVVATATVPIEGFQYYRFPQSFTTRMFDISIHHSSKVPFRFLGYILRYRERREHA